MPISGSTLAKTASAVAVATRKRDPEALDEARRAHAAAKLEQYIERVVAEAPPLTPAQRSRLAGLLNATPPAPRTVRRSVAVDHDLAAAPDHIALPAQAGGDDQ